jgi:NAD(P)-dependent dehydrogenase (short-subunit alcohol dehydrogenase family)
MTIRNWTPERLADQSGKTFVVTGANSGIGFKASKRLVEAGANLIMLCRNENKANAAAQELRQSASGSNSVETIQMDLASLSSVRAAAAAVLETAPRIDALINNAGIMFPPRRTATEEGFELQFGVNHLGHFLLTGLLKDRVIDSEGRFVTVSSLAHKVGLRRIRFKDPNWEQGYQAALAYGQSKFANAMFGFELNRRLEAAGHASRSFICHPGYSATNLQSTGPGRFATLMMAPANLILAQSADRGGWPILLSATDPDAEGGAYYGPRQFREMRGAVGACKMIEPAQDKAAAAKLWALSEQAVDLSWSV